MRVEESIVVDRSPDEVLLFFDTRSNDRRWMASVLESEWTDPDATTRIGIEIAPAGLSTPIHVFGARE